MKKTQVIENNTKLKRVGFFLSLICAIHCAAVPLIILVVPAISTELLHNKFLELGLIVLGALVAGKMLSRDFLHIHKHAFPLLLSLLGFIIQLIGLYAAGHNNSHLVLMAGSVIIALAYLANWRLKANYNASCKC